LKPFDFDSMRVW